MEIALEALNRASRLRDAQLDDMLHYGLSPTAVALRKKRKRRNDENTDETNDQG